MKNRLNPFLRIASLTAFIIVPMGLPAYAGVLTWDGSDTTTSGAQGGAGTWNINATANWWDGAADVVWPTLGGTDDDAVFAGTADTVTLGSDITANDLTFSTTGYTISGPQILTLNGAATSVLTTGTGVTATIGSAIAGSAGFTKAGAGTLIITGNSTNNGAISISAGTLQIGSGATTGSLGSGVVTASGATLAFNRTDSVAAPFVVNNQIKGANGGSIATVVVNSGTVQLGGSADNSDTAVDVKSGATVILAKSSTGLVHAFGKDSNVRSGGILQLAGTGSDQIYDFAPLTVASGGVFDVNSRSETLSTLTLAGTGINGSGALTNSTNSATSTVTAGITLSSATTIGGLGNITTGSVISGTSTGLTKVGAGTLTINGSAVNTFTGGLNVNGGTVALSLNNLTIPTNLIEATNALTLGGGTLSVTGKSSGTTSQSFASTNATAGTSTILLNRNGGTSSTLNLGTFTHSPGGVVNFTTATLMNGTASATEMIKVSNAASGANGGLAAWAVANGPTTSSGRWVAVDATGALKLVTALNNTNEPTVNTNWSGMNASKIYTASVGVTLTGSVSAQAIQNNNTGNNTVTVALGTNTLTVNGLSTIQSGASNLWSFTSSGVGGIKIGAEKELVLIGAGNFAFSAPIANNAGGASGLTHAGGGTVSFTGTHAYTGQTTVNSGIMQVSPGGSINTSSGITVNGGTFLQNNTTTAVTPTITLQGGIIGGTGTINTVNVSNLATNSLSNGSGSAGSTSPLTIGNLTFSGAATVNVNTAGSVGYTVTNTLTTIPSNGLVTLNVTTAPTWVIGNTYNLIGYGSFSGSASDFIKGTIPGISGRLTATLGTTGTTNGFVTLTVGGDNAIWTGAGNGNWTTTAVGSPFNWKTSSVGANTDFIAADNVIFDDTATGTSSITINDANVAPSTTLFNNTTKNYAVSGSFGISSGSLTKSGTGTVTLNTSNIYTGGTTVNAGTLVLGHATDTLANNGAVNISGGTLDIGANSDTVGAVNLNSGSITGTSGVLTGSAYNVQTGSISAKLAGNAGLTKSTSGTVTLTGALNTTNTGGSVIRVTGGSLGSNSILTLSPSSSSVTGALSNNNSVSIGDTFGDYAVFNQTAGTVNSTSVSIGNIGTGTYNLSGSAISNTNGIVMSFTGPFSGTGETFMNISGSSALNIYSNGKLTMGTFYGRKSTIVQTGGNVSFYSDAGTTLGGTGGLAFNGGAGSYTLSGGTLAVPNITLAAANPGAGSGGGTGTVNLNGGTLKITGSSFNIPSGVSFKVQGDGAIANSGANIDTNGLSVAFNAPLTHSTHVGANAIDGGLTKVGSGTLTLSGTNTYTGTTNISAGKLVLDATGTINNSGKIVVGDTGSSGTILDVSSKTAGFAIASTQTLGGIGTVDANTSATAGGVDGTKYTVTISGIHAAGNSVGKQTIDGNLSYAGGSIFEWELGSNVDKTNGTRGTNFDAVDVTGNLAIDATASTGAIFKVILGTNFDGNDAFWTADRSWDVFNATSSSTAFTNFQLFNASAPTTEITSATYSAFGSFGYSYSGGVGTLTWSAVPEPTSALAGLLIAGGLLRRRRA